MASLRLTPFASFLFLASTVVAQATSTTTSAPSATTTPPLVERALDYDPNKAAAGIFAGLYGIASIIIFIRLFGNRSWWGLCLPIGAACMSIGFIIRIIMTIYPNSLTVYLLSTLFILLSPTTFLAFNYILYGRFVVNCIDRRHSWIRPERTARYFVISDISTFIIQGAGGSLLTSTNHNTDKVGDYIIIAGLALQALSYAIFILLVAYTFRSLKRDGSKPLQQPWGRIFIMLFFSSVMFLIRCIYRTIEFAQGLGDGYLVTHEVFFYMFDSLPLLVGILTYAVDWPARYILLGSAASSLLPMSSPSAMASSVPLGFPYTSSSSTQLK